MPTRNTSVLLRDLRLLSTVCQVMASRDLNVVIVRDVCLPPGWNRRSTRMRVDIPEDYPLSPPGVGASRILLDTGLLYHWRTPGDYHEGIEVDGEEWAWWCYRSIHWDPRRDNLVTLLERVRADLSNPR